MRPRALFLIGLAVVVSASVSPRASANADDHATALALLKEGYEVARARTCAQAVPLFERSLALSPTVKAWLNLARCDEQLGRLRDAVDHWARARDLAHTQGLGVLEHAARVRLEALEPRLPTVSLRVDAPSPDDVSILCDGALLPPEALARAIPLDPGAHVFAVSAPGRALRSFEVTLAPGERIALTAAPGDELTATTPPLAAEQPQAPIALPAFVATPPFATNASRHPLARTTTLAGFGVAALGLVVGSAVGGATLAQASSARARCHGDLCSAAAYEEVENARRLGHVATVAFGVAIVGAATGLFGVWLGSRDPPQTGRTAARPVRLHAWAAPVGGLTGAAAFLQSDF